jgi:hypothetical protein
MAGEEIKIGEDDRPIKEVEEGIEELRERLKVEEGKRIAAEGRERKLTSDLREKSGEVHETNQQIVESAIDKLSMERDALKQQYRDARGVGDIDAEIEANDQLADVAAKLNQLQLGLRAMKETPPPAAAGPVRTGDPVEDLARSMEDGGAKQSAAWIRKHPEFARDPKKYAAMIGAHNVAVNGAGLREETPEYYAKVEEVLGINPATRHEPHTDDPPQTSSAATAVRERGADTPPAAAPPSRSTGKNAVRLNADQREAAKISGISEEEYAANLSRGKN